jgi:hypothetical protein
MILTLRDIILSCRAAVRENACQNIRTKRELLRPLEQTYAGTDSSQIPPQNFNGYSISNKLLVYEEILDSFDSLMCGRIRKE